MKPFRSIKGKILIFASCLSLIPVTIPTTIYYMKSRSKLEKEALDKLATIAELKKTNLLSDMEKKTARAIDFGSDGFIRDTLEKISHVGIEKEEIAALNKHLEVNKRTLDPFLGAIAVVDRSGRVVASTSEGWREKDISQEDVFTQTIRLDPNKTYVRTHIFCPYIQKYCIDISTPITSKTGENTLGLIINCYDMAGLSEITTRREGMGDTGEVYIVDKDKTMLTESRFVKGAEFTQLVDTTPVRRALDGEEKTIGVYPDYRGKSVVGVSVYLPEYEWVFVTEIDAAEVFSPLRNLGIVTLAVWLITAILVTGAGMVFATSLSRPISTLKDVTGRFAGGDLNIRVKIDRRDEIGDLGNSFNTMASRLAMEIEKRNQIGAELKALNKSLEQRIVERTQEITKTNELLQVEIREPNDDLINMTDAIGSQTGQFILRRQAEDLLKESEEKFRSISISAYDAIIMMDDKGIVSFWNEAAEKMFGYRKDEAIGKYLQKLKTFSWRYRNAGDKEI